jgi:2-polyprenyl-6-methoxyphenol hydroxylase-like FAD-dependent oxidoreductase
MTHDIHIIGGGLAGSEAAWQLARRGLRVRLSEMRGTGEATDAHQTDALAELVCSNSFRSDDDQNNAVGLLHHEMRQLDSLIMSAAAKAQVPAGSALAVDRDCPRTGRRPAPQWPDHRRHRAADRRRLGKQHRRGDRGGEPRLLRRHRSHRLSRLH